MADVPPVTRASMRPLRKLLALTGVVPLGLFLGFHAYQQSAVLEGRDALLAGLDASSLGLGLSALVLLSLLAHAALGALLATRPDDAEARAYGGRAFRRFQAVTGAVSLLFVLVHAGATLSARLAFGTSASAYAAVFDQTGTAPRMAFYVLGLSATCLHLGQGLAASITRFFPTSQIYAVRTVSGLVAGILWLLLFRSLAVYATAAPLM